MYCLLLPSPLTKVKTKAYKPSISDRTNFPPMYLNSIIGFLLDNQYFTVPLTTYAKSPFPLKILSFHLNPSIWSNSALSLIVCTFFPVIWIPFSTLPSPLSKTSGSTLTSILMSGSSRRPDHSLRFILDRHVHGRRSSCPQEIFLQEYTFSPAVRIETCSRPDSHAIHQLLHCNLYSEF